MVCRMCLKVVDCDGYEEHVASHRSQNFRRPPAHRLQETQHDDAGWDGFGSQSLEEEEEEEEDANEEEASDEEVLGHQSDEEELDADGGDIPPAQLLYGATGRAHVVAGNRLYEVANFQDGEGEGETQLCY